MESSVVYFKTKKVFDHFAKEMSKEMEVRESIVNVGSGETNGAYCYDTELKRVIMVLVLDETEYENAPFKERGE